MIFRGADYNMLYNYKFTKFTVFMRGSGKDGSSCGGGGMCVEVTFWTFEGEDGVSKLSKCEQGVTGGGVFWAFYENITI